MKSQAFKKLVFVSSTVLTLGLVGCGSGDGYYGGYTNAGSGGDTGSEDTDTGSTDGTASRADFDTLLDQLSVEGRYLFGGYNATDPAAQKGSLDHGLDTLTQGPLKLAMDVKAYFDANGSANFTYRPNCILPQDSTSDAGNRGCYAIAGESLKTILPASYQDWDFEISKTDLSGMKLSPEELDRYYGITYVYIFDNENPDKDKNDVWVAGSFSYPYQQSWNLSRVTQKRFVSLLAEPSDYQLTYNTLFTEDLNYPLGATATFFDGSTDEWVIIGTLGPEAEVAVFENSTGEELATATADDAGNYELRFPYNTTKGVFSLYKDPTSTDGSLYVIGNNTGISVLLNDNPNLPDVEVVDLTLSSSFGDTETSNTYRERSSGVQELTLTGLTSLIGQRVENESPDSNSSEFTGNLFMKSQDIFQFSQPANDGLTLDYVYTINEILFSGVATNSAGTVTTTPTAVINNGSYSPRTLTY